jgi:hypothetical protein
MVAADVLRQGRAKKELICFTASKEDIGTGRRFGTWFTPRHVCHVFPNLHRWGGDNVSPSTRLQGIKSPEERILELMFLSSVTHKRRKPVVDTVSCDPDIWVPGCSEGAGRDIFSMIRFQDLLMTDTAAQK